MMACAAPQRQRKIDEILGVSEQVSEMVEVKAENQVMEVADVTKHS